MNINTEAAILALLSLIISLVAYWAVCLESRVQQLKAKLESLQLEVPKDYVRREDFKERWAELMDRLNQINNKLDKLADK